MYTLFVCKGNVGRSQMAEGLYSQYYSKPCFSAGTVVNENEGIKIKDISIAENVIKVMQEEGVDVSNNIRKQLTPKIVDNAEKIIVMAEEETLPGYLTKHEGIIYRDVENPKGLDYEGHKKVIEKIKQYMITLE